MKRIALADIVFDAGTQIRASINEDVVSQYAERMTEGDEFPPVVLFHDGNHYYLADGFHRTLAAKRLTLIDIPSDVRAGTQQDALWFALGANRTNGVRLSHADKRRAAAIAIQTWPDRSASSIAEQIGVHQTFISDMKRQHDAKSALPDRVKGKDGKEYPSSGSGRVTPERVADVTQRLKSGQNISRVAADLKMSTRTVQKIRESAHLPLKRDNTREGVRQRRDNMRAMAADGYTSIQIASELGMNLQACRDILRTEGIEVVADRAAGRTKRHDSNRIVSQMVMDAENLTADANLIQFDDLDASKLAAWIESLTKSRQSLSAFIRRLTEEQKKHGEAA